MLNIYKTMTTDNFTPTPQAAESAADEAVQSVETQEEALSQIDTEAISQSDEDSFAGRSREELTELLAHLIESEPIETLRRTTEAIKISFYKLQRVETERKAEQSAEEEVAEDALELRLKDLLREYRRRRDEYIANIEREREINLKIKLQIIDELKELVASDETLNHTFPKFRELQTRWRETGAVPSADVKDLWERYHLHTENFYNFIKINRELRDLDLKKNLEQKTLLCEQAEALATERSIVEAFRKLQKLHDDWRETGPVANELKESTWTRFKEASTQINKLHQEHFDAIKGEQVKNLESKEALCVRVEELLSKGCLTHKDWNRSNEKLLEIQKEWKGIGFAPKRDNNKIYERFRTACDKFFESKREFYASQKGEMEQNLELKIKICERAEALAQSEDWKITTDSLIALQTEWKSIGAVSQRHSESVWRRFRTACDSFFERRAAHFSVQDTTQDANLKAKETLLSEMESVDIVEAGGFDAIKAFQRRFSEIGYVPIKQKEAIAKRYKESVDRLFATLRGNERVRSMKNFKDRVSSMKSSGDGRVRGEREKLVQKLKHLEADIALLENNIGFFSKSKGAEAMVADVKRKIERAHRDVVDVREKIIIFDQGE